MKNKKAVKLIAEYWRDISAQVNPAKLIASLNQCSEAFQQAAARVEKKLDAVHTAVKQLETRNSSGDVILTVEGSWRCTCNYCSKIFNEPLSHWCGGQWRMQSGLVDLSRKP